ncbi:hypothetical protein [Chitinimonas lacunae]|uniref:Uncharacterized protein n=1 Tax=Chitinimonas lacunae TaxID=1963018 RepID=A0ABV8MNI3_9NEIS
MSGRAWQAWLDESERLLDLIVAHGVGGLGGETRRRLRDWVALAELLGMERFATLGRCLLDEALPLEQRASAALDWLCWQTALMALERSEER